uniref:Putative secreted protein n=1 Tax=Anopheles darlingi TaxID=43151 RepID=A0A2M4DAQ2_ANODA
MSKEVLILIVNLKHLSLSCTCITINLNKTELLIRVIRVTTILIVWNSCRLASANNSVQITHHPSGPIGKYPCLYATKHSVKNLKIE